MKVILHTNDSNLAANVPVLYSELRELREQYKTFFLITGRWPNRQKRREMEQAERLSYAMNSRKLTLGRKKLRNFKIGFLIPKKLQLFMNHFGFIINKILRRKPQK